MSEGLGESTSVSLLEQLQHPDAPSAQKAWGRFVQLYIPLLLLWARRLRVDEQEAPDLVQDVFLVLAREMITFRLAPGLRFRGWLWTILRNKWRDQVRKCGSQVLVEPITAETLVATDNVEEVTEEEHRAYLIARAVELMEAELPADEWRACREHLIKGRPAKAVASELGMTVNQIYLAKSRMLRRLRTEFKGLLD